MNGRQQLRQRDAVGLRLAVKEADVEHVFAVEMFNHPDLAVVQLHHHRQTPAVDGLFAVAQQPKGEPCLAGQPGEGRGFAFPLQPGGTGHQRARGAGHPVAGGDIAKRLRPVLQRLLRQWLLVKDIVSRHGWISTD